MFDFMSGLESHDVVAVVSVVLSFLAGIIVWLSLQWRLHRRTEAEIALKQMMVERGMSAEEIQRVMAANSGTPVDRAEDAVR